MPVEKSATEARRGAEGLQQRRSVVRGWEVRVQGDVFAVMSVPLNSDDDSDGLTPAEHDIVRRILRGDSNKAIAVGRGTAVRTVANQIAAIYQKLGLASRAELAAHVSRPRV